ncbi:MAG: VOC family protein, partial [Verrucomicrobiota bacterium]
MIKGINHITLSVSELEHSIRFYTEILGCDLKAKKEKCAYLSAGALWLCLFEEKIERRRK